MKKLLPLLFLGITAQALHAQNFNKGNIVVARLGNGTNALNTGALPVSLIEINPTAKVVTNTVNIPSTSAGQRLLINGNPNAGANEGGISLSADGRYIVIGGADVTLFDNDTGPDNKSFARINMLGNVELFTLGTGGTINGGFIRATSSTDGSGLWLTANTGIAYVAWGATGATFLSTTGSRYIHVVGNQLYSVSGTNPATILNFGIPPTTAGNNGTALPFTASSTVQSAYGFAMLDMDNAVANAIDGNDVLYIVDQTVASSGIVKMAYNTVSSTWDLIGKYTSTVPFYGLTARKNANNEVELYCVRNSGANNSIVAIVDKNTRTTFNSSSITETVLASAGTNYVFRSVAFSPYDITLPLNLLSFEGKSTGNTASFKWQTSSEVDLKSFIIERSQDGKDFSPIKTITPKNISGENVYQYQDLGLLSGTYYYRLKITDLDGTITYSKTVDINIKAPKILTLFPNPAHDDINITFTPSAKQRIFTVYSNDGRSVKKIAVAPGINYLRVDIAELKAGAYILKTDLSSQTFIKK